MTNSLNAHDLARGPAQARIGSDRIGSNNRGTNASLDPSSLTRFEVFANFAIFAVAA